MNRILVLLAVFAAFTLASCDGGSGSELRIVSATQTVVVTPVNPNGWGFFEWGGGTVDFATNPAPLANGGSESLLFTEENGAEGSDALNTDFDGVKLADITELSYFTYVINNVNVQAPYIVLNIDEDGNGTVDDYFFFEPGYQTGVYPGDTVPDQGDVTLNVWQKWTAVSDSIQGGWWASSSGNGGPPLFTLENYSAAHPDAVLRNSPDYGAVSISAGYGVKMTGHADLFTIGVNDFDTTYNFEVSDTGDCKKGGWQALGYKNQGDCVSAHNNKGQKGKGKGPRNQ